MTEQTNDMDVPTEVQVEHRYAGGWKGGPGGCGAYCSCGETYDGFDTVAEPGRYIDAHVKKMNGDKGCDATESPDGSSDGSLTGTSSTSASPEATPPTPDPDATASEPSATPDPPTDAADETVRFAEYIREFGDGEIGGAQSSHAAWAAWADAVDTLIECMPPRPGVLCKDACGETSTVELGVDHIDDDHLTGHLQVIRAHADAIAAAYSRGARKAAANTAHALRVLRGEHDG